MLVGEVWPETLWSGKDVGCDFNCLQPALFPSSY